MKAKAKKGYVPYKYKSNGNLVIDPVTGLVSSFNPRVKGDGSRARLHQEYIRNQPQLEVSFFITTDGLNTYQSNRLTAK